MVENQVVERSGAGGDSFGSRCEPRLWRRWLFIMAQVCFWERDLRHKVAIYAFQWRKSHPFFRTCAKNVGHLPRPDRMAGFCCRGAGEITLAAYLSILTRLYFWTPRPMDSA